MTLIPYKFHLIFALKGVLSYPVAENVSNSDIFMQHRGVCGSKPLLRRLIRLVLRCRAHVGQKKRKFFFVDAAVREKPGRHAHARVYIIPAYGV